jgi:dihydroorotase
MTSLRSILVRGGRLIDPAARIDTAADILLKEGHVAQVEPSGKIKEHADHVIDARGLVVAPGFIDLHVHLREPGQSYKETIASGTAAAAAGGFTSVCAMPNTTPVNDSIEITRWMQQPERGAVVNVFPIAAATKGSQGKELTDFAALHRAGAVAVSDDGKPILDDSLMRQALLQAARLRIPVIQHAEDTRLTANCPVNQGAFAFRMGLRGQPPEAEARVVQRDITLARETNAHLHVAHISTATALDAVRSAKRHGIRVTCECAPHHFSYIDSDIGEYNTNFKMNPPLRAEADREAMLLGLSDGTIDAIATDHAPHAPFEKDVEFERAAFGITGLEVALAAAITRLHRERDVSLRHIIALLSTNPARIAGLAERGTLSRNSCADITIFDPHKKWTYDVRQTQSKSRNTPYDGVTFYGKVTHTIVGGRIVYQQR